MKIRFTLLVALLTSCYALADVHIQVSDPATWSVQELSQYAGQTVVFDDPIIVCSNTGSSLKMCPWRMFQPQNQGVAGSVEYTTTSHINSTCYFMLSGVSGYHRCGEKIYNLRAKVTNATTLTFLSGTWHGNTRADLEAGLPDLGDYRLLVCGFNLENYFVRNLGKQYLGANSLSEHQAQRTKVSKALKKINADIFGLVELEQGDDAIQEIVNDLNKNLPGRNYKFFHDNTSGSSQKTDYVYDANKVEPIGTPCENNAELVYRKKMLAFREKATGERFIYSINHFKAMNTGDEYRRVNEARAVADFYKTYRQDPKVRDQDLLLMGDLNCYAKTDPIFIFTDQGLIDLHRAFHADSSYSYMYGGLASYIDHAICSETLYRQVTGMSAYHINSDEDDKYTYDKSSDNTMFRCSDHDPVLVGLKLDSMLSHTIEPYFNGADMMNDSLTFYYTYTNESEAPLVYFDIYNINGLPICSPTRIIYTNEIFEKHTKYYTLRTDNTNLPDELKAMLPLPSGLYILHFYYHGTTTAHKLIIR